MNDTNGTNEFEERIRNAKSFDEIIEIIVSSPDCPSENTRLSPERHKWVRSSRSLIEP